MQTAEFGQQMKQRNAIEGTHSELVRAHGLRRARYRGWLRQEICVNDPCLIRESSLLD
jgi:hypothetical protein